jgi:hypothetical protein
LVYVYLYSTLRLIAWALGIPMTQAIERIFEHLPLILDMDKVCKACRDKSKCPQCACCDRNNQSTERR